MKIQNVFTQSQAKHGQHSRIIASGLVSGVGRLMMCACSSVCVWVFSLYLSVSHQSVQLWLLVSLLLKAPQVVLEKQILISWHIHLVTGY